MFFFPLVVFYSKQLRSDPKFCFPQLFVFEAALRVISLIIRYTKRCSFCAREQQLLHQVYKQMENRTNFKLANFFLFYVSPELLGKEVRCFDFIITIINDFIHMNLF